MNVLLTLAAIVCLWHVASCGAGDRVLKMTLMTKNPSYVTVTEHVYFDVVVHNYYKKSENLEGRFIVAVFGDVAPMTVLNFVSIARGYKRGKDTLTYNNTMIHRIVPDYILQMGDIGKKRGQGGTSIYGDTFRDESFDISHSSSGIVSMANAGTDTNNSQFFITLQKARYLDGHHVAFGKVISGMDLLKTIGEISSYRDGFPTKDVEIVASIVQGNSIKYQMTYQQLETESEELNFEDFDHKQKHN